MLLQDNNSIICSHLFHCVFVTSICHSLTVTVHLDGRIEELYKLSDNLRSTSSTAALSSPSTTPHPLTTPPWPWTSASQPSSLPRWNMHRCSGDSSVFALTTSPLIAMNCNIPVSECVSILHWPGYWLAGFTFWHNLTVLVNIVLWWLFCAAMHAECGQVRLLCAN